MRFRVRIHFLASISIRISSASCLAVESLPGSFVKDVGHGIFMSIGGLSIQPVFGPQSRNWFEVGEVAGEQGGIVSQADAGNFRILGANVLTERLQGIGRAIR